MQKSSREPVKHMQLADPNEVTFVVPKLTSLGSKKDRWCVSLPNTVAQLIGKGKKLSVTLRLIGSLGVK
mgnify:CR=1 FL=1